MPESLQWEPSWFWINDPEWDREMEEWINHD